VPVLLDGELTVWDTLAIGEYANELAGGRGWPAERAARARARSISAEMHSGFAALRAAWSFDAAATGRSVLLAGDAVADLARIDAIWSECRAMHAAHGPWLFGGFSIADAMYAPLVLRCRTYGATLTPAARGYYEHVVADGHVAEWLRGAAIDEAARGDLAR
jgi:glutathione S-transferase